MPCGSHENYNQNFHLYQHQLWSQSDDNYSSDFPPDELKLTFNAVPTLSYIWGLQKRQIAISKQCYCFDISLLLYIPSAFLPKSDVILTCLSQCFPSVLQRGTSWILDYLSGKCSFLNWKSPFKKKIFSSRSKLFP